MNGALWLRIGATLGAVAVVAGAFGAHALKDRLDAPSLEVYTTATHYHMYHALALLAVGLLGAHGKTLGIAGQVAGWGFLIGIMVFSGTLYALAVTGMKWLGAITPIGGVSLIVGWIALAVAARSATRS
jgi:uncharacterized membrane protein YgdD (TMEM256/DUF423 family)